MTDWDAARYLKFEKERTRPAIDLLARISIEIPGHVWTSAVDQATALNCWRIAFLRRILPDLIMPGMLAAAKLRLPI